MAKARNLQERITEYNTIQVEERKNLPNLIEMIRLAQNGDKEVFNQYFYGYKVIERFPYDGRMQSYEVNKVRFWDKPLDIFLGHIKKRYTKDTAIGEQNSFGGRKITYKVNTANFEESEIDQLFYEYMIELIEKIELDNFVKDSESKTLNAIRKYIRMGFENHLRKVRNDKVGLERVRVDGELYYVKSKEEEVFYEDIYTGYDEEEGTMLNFIDIVSYEDVYGSSFSEEDLIFTPKKFIEENLEDVLTSKQFEKYQLILEHVKEHGIESIVDKHTGKIIKARVQKIAYPEGAYKNIERIDSLIKIMNKRMEKALDEAKMNYISLEEQEAKEQGKIDSKSSKVEVYIGGFTEEEVEQYFKRHLENILRAFTEGHLTFVKGTKTMLPSDDRIEELPFDVYDRFVKAGRKERLQIIEEYHNRDKFKLRAGKKQVIKKQEPVEVEDKNNKYITQDELRDIRRKAGK